MMTMGTVKVNTLRKDHETGICSAVITGATGMIGLALISYLLKQQIEVLAIIRPNSSKGAHLPKNPLLKVEECDLACLKGLQEKGFGRYDAFFHLGWDSTFGENRNDMYLQNLNIRYTLDSVELAMKLGCHVYVGAGSQAEYGQSLSKLGPDTPTFPQNGYGMAKLCAGQMSRVMCEGYGIRHEWARILSIYGPYDNPNTMIMTGIKDFLEGKRPVFTKGEQLWDYLYVEDCVRALHFIAQKGKPSQIYTIGSGEVRTLGEYINIIRDLSNPLAELGLGERPYADNQVMHLQADISKLSEDTGFVPQICFEEGIENTIFWVKEGMDNEKN